MLLTLALCLLAALPTAGADGVDDAESVICPAVEPEHEEIEALIGEDIPVEGYADFLTAEGASGSEGIPIGDSTFPDAGFRAVVAARLDADGDGALSPAEAESVTELDVSGLEIASLRGLASFPNLKALICDGNRLVELETGGCSMLERLECRDNPLERLSVGGSPALVFLDCRGTGLASVDLTGCERLIAAARTPPAREDGYAIFRGESGAELRCDLATALTAGGETLRFPPKDIAACRIAVKNRTYTGKSLKPSPQVTDGARELVKGMDYTVAYKNNKKVGLATVIVTGVGDYAGTATATFRIKPKGTTLSGLTGGKKKVTVKWKKQAAQVSGYQIEFGTKSDFSNARGITVKGADVTKTTIKGLKARKKYYFRVRTYKSVKGKRYYSSWSKGKSAKTYSVKVSGYRDSHPLRAIAHRGGRGYWPENTLEAFSKARSKGADGVELDVYTTLDGQLVVHHDTSFTVGRKKYNIARCTLEELRRAKPSLCTLDEALEVISEQGLSLWLELKNNADGAACVEAVRRRGLQDRTVYLSFFQDRLELVRAADPSARLSFTFSNPPSDLSAIVHRLGLAAVTANARCITKERVKSWHDAGLIVGAWTVNERSEVRALRDMDVDAICSDYPDIVDAERWP